jgi:hypothetical protein
MIEKGNKYQLGIMRSLEQKYSRDGHPTTYIPLILYRCVTKYRRKGMVDIKKTKGRVLAR